ncbi:DEAD/DEAH box helicase [Octadecabacter sp. 1_MG-2023]|uniref:DEAD/DEAH box helicase n=1 Tax=unclassified Octadecabacter TaxID=196158 RepID=UPI001C09647F|nr:MULTISPECIES: DEAD/DEAH box helicase [unclassified Octadecabacter]MBU2991729.1 DEAD/DEAH box helicase [Octadecabacter sp. B2R22]MDO6735702.1 DEAD/DEAH box helicase [Octadecabacter sp. 1_MG-2023]
MKQTLADALEARGYDTLTAVQEAVSDPETNGKDMLVSAQTGSGKTLGFGLAIAPQILGEGDKFARAGSPLALIIAPTRELALQVKRELAWLFEKAGVVMASTVGGMDMRDERRALDRGAHIVVSTPGRLRDHIMRGSIDLSGLKAVVLDEADEMLDLGFRDDLEFILENAPEDRQTLLFSATVPAAIAKLAKSYQTDALRIATTNTASQHADIEYRALNVGPRDTENAIINVLRYYEAPNAIVFCNTRATVNRMTTRLSNRGFSVVALSGELTQSERTNALQAMRDGRARVCVATDVAARGIDLPNLELVIHAELPTGSDTLLHRSGRTGRAGRKGISTLIVPPSVRRKADRLLGWAKLTAEWADAPSADDVTAKDEERMLEQLGDADPLDDSETGIIGKLTEAYTAEQIATAYLRMYRERHSAPEELAAPNEAPKPRQAFGPSVWFSIAGGNNAGAEPRVILPVVCKAGDVSRDDIGAIRIQKDASFVEIRESAVKGFLAAVGPDMTLEKGMVIERLAAAPKLEPRGPRPDKPRFDKGRSDKPRGDKPRGDKNWGDKPRGEKSWGDKPKYDKSGSKDRKPRHGDGPRDGASKSKGTTTPVDWNDAPEPRAKKPKPDHAKGGKPAFKKKPHSGDSKPANDGAVEAFKPRKANASDPSKRIGRPGAGLKGPKPPAGKASSKKNRARAAAKSTGGKQGGAGRPTTKNKGPGGKSGRS